MSLNSRRSTLTILSYQRKNGQWNKSLNFINSFQQKCQEEDDEDNNKDGEDKDYENNNNKADFVVMVNYFLLFFYQILSHKYSTKIYSTFIMIISSISSIVNTLI